MDPIKTWAETVYNSYLETIKQGGEIPPSVYKGVLEAIKYLESKGYFKDKL